VEQSHALHWQIAYLHCLSVAIAPYDVSNQKDGGGFAIYEGPPFTFSSPCPHFHFPTFPHFPLLSLTIPPQITMAPVCQSRLPARSFSTASYQADLHALDEALATTEEGVNTLHLSMHGPLEVPATKAGLDHFIADKVHIQCCFLVNYTDLQFLAKSVSKGHRRPQVIQGPALCEH
jgi:hypothetical protein